MILTRREKLYSLIAGTVLGVFALDYFILEPYVFAPQAEVKRELTDRQAEAAANKRLFDNEHKLREKWKVLQADGLAANPQDAEAEVRTAINDWTRAEGVAFVSLKSDSRNLGLNNDTFFEKTLQFTGTGTQQSISHLIWRIQSSSLPVKVNALQITARKEGADDLSVQISLSTISPNPDALKPLAATPAKEK